jgi:uncharacterized protein YqkB
MIEFKFEKKEKKLVFSDVQENAFFVDLDGCLCQKEGCSKYNVIANEEGRPWAVAGSDINPAQRIRKILGKPERIIF